MELIPTKAGYRTGERPAVQVLGRASGVLRVWRLGQDVATVPVRAGARTVRLPELPVGGYGIDLEGASGSLAATALDVLDDPFDRPRYGFVADFAPGRDVAAVARHFRALHLNLAQLYDWGYRHAQLVGPTPTYADPLGRTVSVRTVRRISDVLSAQGTLPMGYAAVYAVGAREWPQWRDAGLFRPDGEPWRLGEDFLLLVDPADPRWSAHLVEDLRASLAHAHLAGFHLDQYGWPKRALRADGSAVDLAEAFPELLARIGKDLPEARTIFNNVNDFPTWSTAGEAQDAVYIEVWPPHTQLAHLARLVATARSLRRGQPPVLAAYPSVFARAPRAQAVQAAKLTMATVFSSGGTQLANGEDGALLVDPYYPRNHRAAAATVGTMRRWQDFLVRHGDLLLDRGCTDVSRSFVGGINEEVRVEGPARVVVSTEPDPGAVWVRAVRTPHGLVLHLVNLTGQDDAAWDEPKRPVTALRGLALRLQATGLRPGRVLCADPDGEPGLHPATVRRVDGHDVVRLPALRTWMLVHLPDA